MIMALTRWLGAALWAAYGLRAAITTPRPRRCGLEERLAAIPRDGLPLNGRVTVYWDEHQVPFIEAESDEDLAVALGVVHAHLRLAQLELLRRASQGRLAELFGPIAIGLDHALRILDYGRAVPAIVAALPEGTRRWLDRFVAGINHYLVQAESLPPEFALLGLEREPWRIEDVLRVGRLAATDVTWLVWFRLLRLRRAADWTALWRQLAEASISPAPGPAVGGAERTALESLLLGASRSGSNALALSPARSATGAALLASDPHLSLTQPNLWLIAGYRSPSYQATGLMVPGLPFVAIGRNPWIAWAGTNLHAASSELVDVSGLPAQSFRARRERIGVRWSHAREVVVRESEFGPIVTDAPPLRWTGPETLALRWIGHQPSDETTAMLRVNQARDLGEFSTALEGFAVPGLTMLYVERSGRIGRLMAAHLPARKPGVPPHPFARADELAPWDRIVTSRELPTRLDPDEGYLVSANERPREAHMLFGFFFSPDDRYRRMSELIEGSQRLALEQVMELQRDVRHRPTADLIGRLKLMLAALAASCSERSAVHRLFASLEAWDGRYDAESAGALGFELLFHGLGRELVPAPRRRAYVASWHARALLARDIARASEEALGAALRRAVPAAARRFARFESWGALHRLRLEHPLAAVPWIGGRFVHGDFPASGSSETVMKTAHPSTDRRHSASYGSTARMVCDLSSAERTYLVLLGGQDGWPGSTTALDQVSLWRRGGYIPVPLTPERARGRARHLTELRP